MPGRPARLAAGGTAVIGPLSNVRKTIDRRLNWNRGACGGRASAARAVLMRIAAVRSRDDAARF